MFGRKCNFSSRILCSGLLIDLIEKGKLKADKSKLKKLMGSIVNKRGNVFNHEVFSVINCFNGYIVNEKVSKINKCKVQK